ncbi:hypothetical protein SanaruYs_01600 [Chryseotalea sanaruensis]|uniref:Uncharacterized protein n=1 Tax=Chryseotalea sanaruensis TaxID=2482724 RepID=A0A401U510_9BACT|nr:hypothetical protein [Chryseotalea sanaruensis]GCC49945.1 hypothetical protein SanaruYs_01600 [Chryseotalea sanaruensis]
MAKTNNIVHQYFKKQLEGFKLLVKVNPIHFKGTEIMVPESGEVEIRDLEFDAEIFDDLKADGFTECTALEFNLYASGLAK